MYKVLLDSDKYLLSYSTLINLLKPDVHHMTSQISSILIDFYPDLCTIFRSFFQSLNLHNFGTRKDIKKRQTAMFLIFQGLSDRTIKIFMSFALLSLSWIFFSIGPELFFWAHPKDSSFELKSPTNMTLSERLLIVWKS